MGDSLANKHIRFLMSNDERRKALRFLCSAPDLFCCPPAMCVMRRRERSASPMGTCCCGEEGARSIVVIGTPGAGVTTVARRLRELCAHPVQRDESTRGDGQPPSQSSGAQSSLEAWFPAPLPTLAMDNPAVPVQYRRTALRIVDAGPCTLRPPLQRPTVPDAGPAAGGAQAKARTPDGTQAGGPEQHARDALARCDAVILVIDASQPIAAQGAGSVAALIARTKAHGRPMAVLLTKYDTASRRSLPSFLSPRLVASALQLRERKGPWSCYPCIATHRCLNLDPVLGFLLSPDRVPPTKAAPQLDIAPPPAHEWQAQQHHQPGHHRRQSSGVASHHGASTGSADKRRSRVASGGYVEYSDGATYAPQPTSAAAQPGMGAAAQPQGKGIDAAPPCSSFPDDDHGTPPPPHGSDYAMLIGAGSPHVFFKPNIEDVDAEDAKTTEMFAKRIGTRIVVATEQARVDGPEIHHRAPATTPGPFIQLGHFRVRSVEEEFDLNAWYAEYRLPTIAAMPGAIAARKLVTVAGWAKHVVLYEFVDAEAHHTNFMNHEILSFTDGEWTNRVVKYTAHAPGSPSIGERLWPEV